MSGSSDPRLAALLDQAATLAGNADYNSWAEAVTLADAVAEARRRGGDAAARRAFDSAAARSGLDPKTLRGRVTTIEFLREHGLVHMAEVRLLPIGVAAKIVSDRYATYADKHALLTEYYKAAVADPSRRDVRAEVGRRLQALRAAKSKDLDWKRSTDLWSFGSADPRFGRAGQPFRLPGQAALSLVERFYPGDGRVISAFCASGTVLDACVHLAVEDFVGLDLRLDRRVREKHSDHFVQFDCTSLDWGSVCAPGTAAMVIVTPPPFTFGKSAETDSPRDLGRLLDPEEWVTAMACAIAGATHALMVGGVIAVAVRATAEFEHGAPVPDLRYEIGRLLAEAGYECFLGNPIVTVGRARAGEHAGAWLRPEAVQIVVMRKA